MDERGRPEVVATIDPKLDELFAAGGEAYRNRGDLGEIEIDFDDAGRYCVSVSLDDPRMVAEEALQDLANLKGYFADGFQLDYSPDERVRAFVRGFGAEAANQGDLRTAISVFDAIIGEDQLARLSLRRVLREYLERP